MMLPSGNDAAQSLAIHFGIFLLKEEFKNLHKNLEALDEDVIDILKINSESFPSLDQKPQIVQRALGEFYKQMNREAMYMQLKNTHFASAHGMFHE